MILKLQHIEEEEQDKVQSKLVLQTSWQAICDNNDAQVGCIHFRADTLLLCSRLAQSVHKSPQPSWAPEKHGM